jgi:hypothetical protein
VQGSPCGPGFQSTTWLGFCGELCYNQGCQHVIHAIFTLVAAEDMECDLTTAFLNGEDTIYMMPLFEQYSPQGKHFYCSRLSMVSSKALEVVSQAE